MIKKIKNKHITDIALLTILIAFIISFLIYRNVTKTTYDESMRIDSEAIYINTAIYSNENHLIKTYLEYTDLLSKYKTTGRLTESKFVNNDFITYTDWNPCSGIIYPVAIRVTKNKVSIKSITDGKGACSGSTLFIIPIEKNKLDKLPTVEIN